MRPKAVAAGTASRVLHLSPSRSWLIIAVMVALAGLTVRGASGTELYAPEVAAASQRFGIPELWIRAVMRIESAGDRLAVSHRGAMGLMQVMPSTWAALRVRHGLGADPFAPQDNILAGTAYLREMLDRFGTVSLMLSAYNAGPGRVDDHLETGRPLPAETRAYVAAATPMLTGGDPGAIAARLAERGQRSADVLFVPPASAPPRQDLAPAATVFVPIASAGSAERATPGRSSPDRPTVRSTHGDGAAGTSRGGLFALRRGDGVAP